MKPFVITAALVALIGIAGCNREPQPVELTASDYQSQIDKVKADEKMPPGIKTMVIGQLEGKKKQAESKTKGS